MRVALAFLGLLTVGAVNPPAPNSNVFSCSIGRKQVSVKAVGNELVYRFGGPGKPDLVISGSVARKNLFTGNFRYSDLETQLRFVNGRFSYVVFWLSGNRNLGTRNVSGLAVLDGTKHVSDLLCNHWARLDDTAFASWNLPEDGEHYSAISGG